jgi:hypothetical protein
MVVDKWRQYIQHQEFLIKTDHKSLAYLNDKSPHSEMQKKAMARLMGPKFKIVYTKGKDNAAADALSRVAYVRTLQSVSAVKPSWIQEVLNSYQTDPQAQALLTELAISSPNAAGFMLDQGLITQQGKIWIGSNSALQTKLISAFHSSVIGGHSGIKATQTRVAQISLGKASNKMWNILCINVRSVKRLNITITILLGYFNLCLYHREHGNKSQWTLWKDYQLQSILMLLWWWWTD